MNSREMIDYINKHIAEKTLGFGCRITSPLYDDEYLEIVELFDIWWNIFSHSLLDKNPNGEEIFVRVRYYSWNFWLDKIWRVIWKPVHRWHIDAYVDKYCFISADKENFWSRDMQAMNNYWNSMHYLMLGKHEKPIEDQSDEFLEYVCTLIS